MARKTLPATPATEDVMTLADILKSRETLPTHDAMREEAIRAGFMAELKPSTPYQMVLVSHLVDMEMDIQQVRSIKTGILRDTLAHCVEDEFEVRSMFDNFLEGEKTRSEAAKAALNPSHKDHKRVLNDLLKRGVSMNDLLGRAYQRCSKRIIALELELDRAYRRRQALRSQFDALARVERVVEDADVMDA
ncbi:hypothetical protein N9H60_03025 [Flavimaricola sp.]|nr:hypothetical protein [Flavimaricola sp.]MDA9020132.1 hypothetical protein [Flavimaricola sp.]